MFTGPTQKFDPHSLDGAWIGWHNFMLKTFPKRVRRYFLHHTNIFFLPQLTKTSLPRQLFSLFFSLSYSSLSFIILSLHLFILWIARLIITHSSFLLSLLLFLLILLSSTSSYPYPPSSFLASFFFWYLPWLPGEIFTCYFSLLFLSISLLSLPYLMLSKLHTLDSIDVQILK